MYEKPNAVRIVSFGLASLLLASAWCSGCLEVKDEPQGESTAFAQAESESMANRADIPSPQASEDLMHTSCLGPTDPKLSWVYDVWHDNPVLQCSDLMSVTAKSIEAESSGNVVLACHGENTAFEDSEGNPCGKSEAISVSSQGTELWRVGVDFTSEAAPAVDAKGVSYVASASGSLRALTPSGALLWESQLPENPRTSTPTLGSDHLLRVLTSGWWIDDDPPVLHAFDTDGELVWECVISYDDEHKQIPVSTASGIAVGSDGTTYIALSNAQVVAVSSDGEIAWHVSLPDIGPDQNGVSAKSNSDELSFEPDRPSYAAPILMETEDVVVVTEAAELFVLDRCGNIKYAVKLGSRVLATPAAGSDNCIYVPVFRKLNGGLCCVRVGEGVEWTYTHEEDWAAGTKHEAWFGAPVVDSAGNIYAGAGHSLLCIDSAGSLVWSYNTADAINGGGAIFARPALLDDGKLVAVTIYGQLLCFEDSPSASSVSSPGE